MTTSSGRRRQAFPGVPPPGGGHDVDATHVWPGLADELAAEGEPERRDPALAEPLTFTAPPGTAEGDTIVVVPDPVRDPEGTRVRVDERHTDEHGATHITGTPVDAEGEPVEVPWLSRGLRGVSVDEDPADVWGGSRPGVAHLGLGQADEPAPEEGSGVPPLGWSPIGLDVGPPDPGPAPELGGPPTWQIGVDEDEREVVVDPADGERRAWFGGGEDRPHPDDEPEYRAETTEDGEGIAVTMPCGCSVTLRPCR